MAVPGSPRSDTRSRRLRVGFGEKPGSATGARPEEHLTIPSAGDAEVTDRTRIHLAYVALGLCGTFAFFLFPAGGVAQAVAFNALGLSSVVAILVGVARYRPQRPLPWYLFAAGQLAFVLGDAIFNFYELALHVESPFPSVADGLYVFGYAPLIAALLILIGSRSPGQERSAFIDAAIVAVSLGWLAWLFLMVPYAHDTTLSIPQRLISIAYPFMDVLLVGVGVRLLVTGGRRTASFKLVILGIGFLLAADIVYSVMTLAGTYRSGLAVDAGWMISYVVWGAAALHPSMSKLFELIPYRTPKLRRHRIALFGAAALMPPAVLVAQEVRHEPIDAPVIAAGSAILVLLVLAYMSGLVRRISASGLDSLTGLPSQEPLTHALRAAVGAARHGRRSVLLYVDLHRFAIVNDTLGRSAGDDALAAVAHIITENVRQEDLVVRMGGDEFAILAGAVGNVEARELAERIRETIGRLRLGEGERIVDMAVSIGIATVGRGVRTEEILARAMTACDRARARGRDKIELFHDGMDDGVRREDGTWAARLKDGLRNDQFVLLLQPIVEVKTRKIHHYEVLLRLRCDDGRLISAGDFIPAAERLGLIDEIDRWVMRTTVERVAEERGRGIDLACAINLSGMSLRDEAIIVDFQKMLAQKRVPPEAISFEITETAAVANLAQAAALIERLRRMGCSVALDDFGSGFSSYAYLRSLNIDLLKIDGAFVRELGHDGLSEAMVLSINQVAHSIGVATVGEAVENEEILQVLKRLGTDMAQGFYLGPPEIQPAPGEPHLADSDERR